MEPKRIIVGITGASGAPYAKRLLERLAQAECEIHLVASALGRRLASAPGQCKMRKRRCKKTLRRVEKCHALVRVSRKYT